MGRMDDLHEEPSPPATYPPGFEPPTDIDVPWFAWVLWPLAILALLGLAAFAFRMFMTWLT